MQFEIIKPGKHIKREINYILHQNETDNWIETRVHRILFIWDYIYKKMFEKFVHDIKEIEI